jgi:hypothetical protein
MKHYIVCFSLIKIFYLFFNLDSPNSSHPFFNSSNKSDSNSSSTAYNNLDHLLRHAASNTDVSEAALHSILSSFHSPTCLDSSSSTASKHSISSKTSEALQTLLAQQHHHHHHQKKNLSNNKHCEFCCCEFSEGRNCSSTNPTNGPITGCVTCMALPGTTTTTVMGTTITGALNQRDVEMKERLKLKLTKRNLTEQQTASKDQQKKNLSTNKKHPIQNDSKTKEFLLNEKNNIDDLVRFIDGNETISSNNNEHPTSDISSATTTTTNETTSKKNKKKKDKQTKINNEESKTNSSQSKEQQQINQKKQNGSNINQPAPYVFL